MKKTSAFLLLSLGLPFLSQAQISNFLKPRKTTATSERLTAIRMAHLPQTYQKPTEDRQRIIAQSNYELGNISLELVDSTAYFYSNLHRGSTYDFYNLDFSYENEIASSSRPNFPVLSHLNFSSHTERVGMTLADSIWYYPAGSPHLHFLMHTTDPTI